MNVFFIFIITFFKLTTFDSWAEFEWWIITSCFSPVITPCWLQWHACSRVPAPSDSCERYMGESLEIWTEIPACPALLSGECSTIQTKGWVWGGGETDKSLSEPRPPPSHPQAHRHTFHNITARLRDHKTRAVFGFCDALKRVFCLTTAWEQNIFKSIKTKKKTILTELCY